MEKKYRIIFEFSATSDESVEEIEDQTKKGYIREFLDVFFNEPSLFQEYARASVVRRYLNEESSDIKDKLNLKTEKELFIPAIQKVSPRAAAFLLNVLFSGFDDSITVDEQDYYMSLIYKLLSPGDVEKILFEDVESAAARGA